MIFTVFGKPLKVIKKTEYGLIVLFTAEYKVNVDSAPDPKKQKLQEAEKLVLCGDLCDEITCPFLAFGLRVELSKGSLYRVLSIS